MEAHSRAKEHLPYGMTQCYLPPDTWIAIPSYCYAMPPTRSLVVVKNVAVEATVAVAAAGLELLFSL